LANNGTPIADFEARKKIKQMEETLRLMSEFMATQSKLNKVFQMSLEEIERVLRGAAEK